MPVSQRTRKILITIFLLMSPVVVALMLYFAVKSPARAPVAGPSETKGIAPTR